MSTTKNQFSRPGGACQKRFLALRTACATKLLPLLLLLALPAALQAQDCYTYTTNNGVITITGYCGSGGAVDIPDTITGLPVTSIGAWAFYDSTNLTKITIPSSVTSIGDSAFEYCFSLSGVYFQGNAPSADSSVFGWDRNATVYYLPGSTGWGTSFGGVSTVLWQPYTYTTNNGTITITGCGDVGGGALAIPSMINGYPLTSIGSGAFAWCSGLSSVTIPNSVTSIGNDAFACCFGLTSATIGSGVTSIGYQGFWSCVSLTGIYFQGNAPSADSTVFSYDNDAAAYYMPWATGWDAFLTNAGIPAVLWNPQMQTTGASFGVRTNGFGFTITGTSGLVVVVEACTDMASPAWSSVGTYTLTGGSSYFSDPQWTNYARRFYRPTMP